MGKTTRLQAQGFAQMELFAERRSSALRPVNDNIGVKLSAGDVARAAILDRQLANRSRGLSLADCYKRCGYSADDYPA